MSWLGTATYIRLANLWVGRANEFVHLKRVKVLQRAEQERNGTTVKKSGLVKNVKRGVVSENLAERGQTLLSEGVTGLGVSAEHATG